ncbi:DMT family transporter [Pantoea sp. Mb-10]|uniref:DMT family transporter n=1 Tax=unclassified Pantoea TaxID=2630326 RepID=UPI001E2F9555|nr:MULTISPECIES: DMT family transporter [unclassified Pantoea]MCE0490289.1 DMT family transporter [Pantoea sp. Mb-10]MCE0501420.1 DMT family transporter [Pantoea sp. Pb-8]
MKLSDFLRLLSLSAIWGSSFIFMRYVVPQSGIISTSFFRELIGALGLILIVVLNRKSFSYYGKFKYSLMLGVINSAIPFMLYSAAAKFLPAGYSAIFNATTPIMAILIGAIFFHDGVNTRKLLGVFIGLLGVVTLSGVGPVTFGAHQVFAALACLGSAACYGLAGYLSHKWIYKSVTIDNALVAMGSQLGATFVMTPIFLWGLFTGHATIPLNGDDWLALAALGLLCSTVAYILYFRLLKDIGAVKASSVTFLVPVFGVIFGALFLGEKLSLAHVYGGGLIFISLIFILVPERKTLEATSPAT